MASKILFITVDICIGSQCLMELIPTVLCSGFAPGRGRTCGLVKCGVHPSALVAPGCDIRKMKILCSSMKNQRGIETAKDIMWPAFWILCDQNGARILPNYFGY